MNNFDISLNGKIIKVDPVATPAPTIVRYEVEIFSGAKVAGSAKASIEIGVGLAAAKGTYNVVVKAYDAAGVQVGAIEQKVIVVP